MSDYKVIRRRSANAKAKYYGYIPGNEAWSEWDSGDLGIDVELARSEQRTAVKFSKLYPYCFNAETDEFY